MLLREDGTPETRGAEWKHDWDGFNISEVKLFADTSTQKVLNSAKYYAKSRNLLWLFRCWTVKGIVYIRREM